MLNNIGYKMQSIKNNVLDTAIIIPFYGEDQLRIDSVKIALEKLKIQNLKFCLIFVELLFNKESQFENQLKTFENYKHIKIYGNEDNKIVWQKECLINIGCNNAKEFKYYILLDGDVYSDRAEWLYLIRKRLSQNNKIVQGFKISKDTLDPQLYFVSFGCVAITGNNYNLSVNPGLCWGISREYFEKINGLNTWFITGCGDSGFIVETLYKNGADEEMYKYEAFKKIIRTNIEKTSVDYVDVNINHVNHGMFENRSYNTAKYCVNKFSKNIKDLLVIDKNNLLSWSDPKCLERTILSRRSEMFTNDIVDSIFKEVNYYECKTNSIVLNNFSKVIHVFNTSKFNNYERLKKAQNLSLESILKAKTDNVLFITASYESIESDLYINKKLSRTAKSVFNDQKDLPFLKDLLDIANENANDEDWLLFTNSDCCVNKNIYDTILKEKSNFIEFHRLDVFNSPQTLNEVMNFPNKVYDIGVDGIAIRAKYYKTTRNLIPDFVIGEPHWDTCVSGIYKKITNVTTDISNLYHPDHERTWDINHLSTAGKINQSLLVKSLSIGLTDTTLISIPSITEESKIFHVFNYANFENSPRLKNTQNLSLSSILNSKNDRVITITASSESIKVDDCVNVVLNRTTKSESYGEKDLPFLKDLLDIAYNNSKCGDWLLFTNSDCCVSEDMYNNILKDTNNVIVFHRLNIYDSPITLEDMKRFRSTCELVGVDGIAIKHEYYETTRDLIPDFVIGEPYWDTGIFGFYNKITNVTINITDLYHIYHEKTWSLDSLTVAGERNERFFLEMISSGLMDQSYIYANNVKDFTEPYTSINKTKDTAIIVVFYGNDEKRIEVLKKSLKETKKQRLDYALIFVELLFDNQESNFDKFLQIFSSYKHSYKHIKIYGNERNKYLWQKENLINIGCKNAKEFKYFILLDGDVYSDRAEWFDLIRNKLNENNNKIVQGFRVVKDTLDSNVSAISIGAEYIYGLDSDLKVSPGLCWGISREYFEKINGLNTWFITGCGDSAFVAETLDLDRINKLKNLKWCENLFRKNLDKAELDCVDVDVIHINHGLMDTRNYYTRDYCVEKFNKNIKEIICLDNNGLLSWIDLNCVERSILKRKPEMKTTEDVDFILNEEFCLKKTEIDTAIIVVYYGDDEKRKNSTNIFLEKLKIQKLDFCLIFVELLFDKDAQFEDKIKTFKNHKYMKFYGKDDNKYLWQKECLINIGCKNAKEFKYYILLDSDIYSDNLLWLSSIRNKLHENGMKLVHGFRMSIDTEDHLLSTVSYGASLTDFDCDLPINPGLCWGISREYFEKINGLNTWFYVGSGDSTFVFETTGYYSGYLKIDDCFKNYYRYDTQKTIPDCVDIDVVHINHGYFKERAYTTRLYCVNKFNKAINETVYINDHGLLTWIDNDCKEKSIIKRKSEMISNEEVDKILIQEKYYV